MQSSALRRRHQISDKPPASTTRSSSREFSSSRSSVPQKQGAYSTVGYLLSCTIVAAIVLWLSIQASRRLPEVKGKHVERDVFSAERAWDHVAVVGKDYKWVGSEGLEEAMDYIEDTLRAMDGVEVDRQWASGVFESGLSSQKFPVSYGNITNVVARIGPKSDSLGSLIVNSHVDSAAGSKGASDDCSSVGVMLELVRNLVGSGKLTRQVVFLFNGAEEPVLAGAHAFVTQHPWAADLAVLINLEAMGSGTTTLLFRLGPGASWLARAYARAVEYPFAMSSSNDLHQTGLIPGETDKRIFDEFTNVPGFDFVLFENGYTYHTSSDDIAHLSKAGLQHMGETTLSLILELAGEQDAIGKQLGGEDRSSSYERFNSLCNQLATYMGFLVNADDPPAVFYHVLNRLTLTYDQGLMVILNLVLATVTVSVWAFKFALYGRNFLYKCLQVLVIYLVSIIYGLVLTGLVGLFLSSVGVSMTWYGMPALLFYLYIPCLLVGILQGLELLASFSLYERLLCMMFALTMFYLSVMLMLTYSHLTTAAQAFFYLLPFTILAMLPSGWRISPLFAYLVVCIPFSIFGVPPLITLTHILVPVLGRVGNKVSTDVIAGIILVFLSTIVIVNPFLLVLGTARPIHLRRVRLLCIVTGALAILYAVLLRLPSSRESDLSDRPYKVGLNSLDPRYSNEHPKRIIAIHQVTDQLLTSPTKSFFVLCTTDSVPIAQNGLKKVMMPLPGNITWGSLSHPSGPFESVRPFAKWVSQVTSYSASEFPPLAFDQPRVNLVSEILQSPSTRNVTILIHAPSTHQITLRVPTDPSAPSCVTQWSLGSTTHDLGDGGGAWARHVGHGKLGDIWIVWAIVRGKFVGDITSSRFGKSKSTLLSKIEFGDDVAPVFIQVTSTSFNF